MDFIQHSQTTDLTGLYILIAIPFASLLIVFVCILLMTSYLSQINKILNKISSDLVVKFNQDNKRNDDEIKDSRL